MDSSVKISDIVGDKKEIDREKPNLKSYGKSKERRKKNEEIKLGPCSYIYETKFEPSKGFLNDIDFYHFRDNKTIERNEFFITCLDDMKKKYINNEILLGAIVLGLTNIVKKLMKEHSDVLDPLFVAPPSSNMSHEFNNGLNAIQEAIRGGYAEMVKILSSSNNNLIIDKYGRTVEDYVRMKGSPIRSHDAETILGIQFSESMMDKRRNLRILTGEEENDKMKNIDDLGWNNYTSFDVEETCDIDVIQTDMSKEIFVKEYFSTGRPFILRGAISREEILAYSKSRWSETTQFNLQKSFPVGPTAYPSLTGQQRCQTTMTIPEIEQCKPCKEMPDIPMVHAHHPKDKDFDELYPMYNGNVYHEKGSSRKLKDWFGSFPHQLSTKKGWQIFMGGDESGATLHWHGAAYNILYAGIKDWILTPPLYRGFTGMPARKASDFLRNEDPINKFVLRCTQQSGDIIFVPNYWGHATLNHGFTIGQAVILSNDYQADQYYDKPKMRLGINSLWQPSFTKNLQEKKIPETAPQILFVHINKTGGTSIIRQLSSKCKYRHGYMSERWMDKIRHRSFHATADSYIRHHGREVWDSAYTFAVVRHPLARQVSNFFFLLNQCKKRNFNNCEKRHILKKYDYAQSDEEKIGAFHDWMWRASQAFPRGSPDQYLLGSLGHGNEEYQTFNSTQTSWLVDQNGDIVVKNIFHLENIDDDMITLAEAIPCLKDTADSGEEKVELDHLNPTPPYPHYTLFAKNEATNKIMKEFFYVDYTNFGYEFP